MEIISTFIIYSLMYFVSLVFFNKAEKYTINNKRKLSMAMNFIAIAIPCVFAAFRAETVGTDVHVYAKPYYLYAQNSDFGGFRTYFSAEIAYSFIVYISANVFHSFHMQLLLTQLATIIPVTLVAFKLRNKIKVWQSMLCYYLIFYIATFNLMRQSIAAAWLLLAYVLLFYEKNRFWGGASIIVALLFHNSTIIGIGFLIFAYIINNTKKKNDQWILFFTFCLIMLLLFNYWDKFVFWGINSGILPDRFSDYIEVFKGATRNNSSYYFNLTLGNYFELIYRILMSLLPFVFFSNKKNSYLEYSTGIISLSGTFIYAFTFLCLHTNYGLRISWFSEFFNIIWCALAFGKIDLFKGKITKGFLFVGGMLFLFWIIGYMRLGWHGTLPLRFNFE